MTINFGVLDVLAKLDDKYYCDIEMQMGYTPDSAQRILKYWSTRYSKQIKKGEDYDKLQKVIVVFIANFTFNEFKHLPFMSTWKIREDKYNTTILTDKLEIRIIELPKIIEKIDDRDSELVDWLFFLENPKSDRVVEKMKVNKELKEANEKLEEICSDEELQRLIELREKGEWERNSARRYGFETGRKEGLEAGLKEGREQGIKQGHAEGHAKGIKEGIKEGRTANSKEIALALLHENIDIKVISKVTGLSIEDIKTLK